MKPASIDDAALVEVLRQRQYRQTRMRPATLCALLGLTILGAALLLRGVL